MFRSLAILAVYIVLGAPTGVLGILWTLLTGNIMPLYRAGMWIAAFGLRVVGVRVAVEGRENIPRGASCIFMANHVSNLDPPVLIPLLPGRTSVLLKQGLMRIPLLGPAMRLAGFVPVVRAQQDELNPEQARRNAAENVARAAEALRRGLHIALFPEGTRSQDGRMLPFRKGPFWLAAETGAPIVPVSIHGTETMMPKGTLRLRRGTAHVVFHPSVYAAKDEDRDALMLRVRAVIASGLPPEMR